MTRARWFHALTFAVVTFALVLQLVLVIEGNAVFNPDNPPGLVTRVVRYFSYLTIWSNALVCWSTFTLMTGRDRNTRWWRALRADAVVICLGGGTVHFFFLRPILDLHGADALADHLLHQVVPLLATIGFVVFGPRGRIDWSDLGRFLVVPLVWVVYTLVRGPFVDWYPYPFIDVDAHGYGVVLLNVAGIAVFLTALFVLARWLDPRLAGSDV